SITAEKFDKEYLYNIRHNYGKEGNRKDYTPYTCAKVISTTPGVGQVHGCPFRTHSADSLRAMLGQLQVSHAATDEAVAKASAGHFQLACAAAWKGKHGSCCESGINHPNQYFEESQKALTAPGEVAITPRPPSARGTRPATTPGSVLPSPLGCLDGAGGPQTTPTPAKQARLA
ncbi:DNA primase, partial [Helicosporidium sp. ATCC 50920]